MTSKLFTFTLMALLALGFAVGCQKRNAAEQMVSPTSAEKPLYQCAMHPNVVSDHPGNCPICGMELQKVSKVDAAGIPGRAAVRLTDQQKQLINIRTVPVEKGPVSQTIRVVGRVVVNEEKTGALNSRVSGWVEKLDVDTTGQKVAQGQPLMSIYSPDLYAAQQDFLIASRQGGALGKAARKRLELWGISDAQIDELARSGSPTNTLELAAPLAGTVIEKNVVPAQMIQPGMTLYKIADLSEVWVQAELCESELPFVQKSQPAIVTIPAYPNRTWKGTVDFIYPYLQGTTRTNLARVVLPNPDGLLKPDMYVNVELRHDLQEQLSVPSGAVFDTGRQQYLFVEQSEGVFVPALVELGPMVGERQVIQSGVEVGAKVVVDGNFLLDSESQLKAAASAPAPEKPAKTDGQHPLPMAASVPVQHLVSAYEKVRASLAQDSLAGVASAAQEMTAALTQLRAQDAQHRYAENLTPLEKSVGALSASDLELARVQFGTLSAALIDLFQLFPPPLTQSLNVVHCPMWKKSPADWLQVGPDIKNPFLGQQMLTCGSVVTTIPQAR